MRWRAPSPPLLVARRLTACSTICAPSLTSLLAGLRVVPCRHGLVQGPPTSAPSTTRRCGPPATSSGYVPRLRRSATRSAAPSPSALHCCGCRVRGDTRVGSPWAWLHTQACLDAAGPQVPPQGPWCVQAMAAGPPALLAQPLRGRRGSMRATTLARRASRPVRGPARGGHRIGPLVRHSLATGRSVPKRWARACAIAGARPAA